MNSAPRLRPARPDEWTEKARDMFGLEGPDSREKGSPSNVVLTLAHHPSLGLAYLKFSYRLLATPKLSPRIRELVALYIGWHNESEYEWLQHIEIGRAAGIGPDELEAIKVGSEAPGWSELDRNVLRAMEQLFSKAKVDDDTWNGLAAELDKQQLLELLFVIGNYAMLSWIINATGIQPEGDVTAMAENWKGKIKT